MDSRVVNMTRLEWITRTSKGWTPIGTGWTQMTGLSIIRMITLVINSSACKTVKKI